MCSQVDLDDEANGQLLGMHDKLDRGAHSGASWRTREQDNNLGGGVHKLCLCGHDELGVAEVFRVAVPKNCMKTYTMMLLKNWTKTNTVVLFRLKSLLASCT